jgi:hypothetical protein
MLIGLVLLMRLQMNWLLPEHIADALPSEAAQIERLRRRLLDLLPRAWLRAGHAAAARTPRLAADRVGTGSQAAHLQARRSDSRDARSVCAPT